MKVSEAVATRHSTRGFLDRPVPEAVVRRMLERAARAPSGGNLQPWHVYALTGARLGQLKAIVKDRLDADDRETGDYVIYPPNLWEPLRGRRREAGKQRYEALGVTREENGQAILEAMNFAFFGAPVGLFFCLDRRVGPPQWAHLGMYMQTLMLLAVEAGLAACPQEIWSVWPRTVAKFVDMPDGLMLIAGMSLGYEDKASPMNGYRTSREPLERFASLIGFEEEPAPT